MQLAWQGCCRALGRPAGRAVCRVCFSLACSCRAAPRVPHSAELPCCPLPASAATIRNLDFLEQWWAGRGRRAGGRSTQGAATAHAGCMQPVRQPVGRGAARPLFMWSQPVWRCGTLRRCCRWLQHAAAMQAQLLVLWIPGVRARLAHTCHLQAALLPALPHNRGAGGYGAWTWERAGWDMQMRGVLGSWRSKLTGVGTGREDGQLGRVSSGRVAGGASLLGAVLRGLAPCLLHLQWVESSGPHTNLQQGSVQGRTPPCKRVPCRGPRSPNHPPA